MPVEAHEPTEAAVWLDAMAQSLRAGAADGAFRQPQRLADERGHLRRCVLATGLIDLNPRLDLRHASGGDCLMIWERIAQRVLKEPLFA